jgi:hypothetical protein
MYMLNIQSTLLSSARNIEEPPRVHLFYKPGSTNITLSTVSCLINSIWKWKLRTGVGAHYKYPEHCHEVLKSSFENLLKPKD